MFRKLPSLVLTVSLLAACGGNPFDARIAEDEPTPPPPTTTDPGPIANGSLPGTTNPTPSSAITRFEARGDGNNEGNGFANNFNYDAGTDTFVVSGLAFDGVQPGGARYTRATGTGGTPIALGSGFAAYEGPAVVPDSVTGDPIAQLPHRAVLGTGTNTELAIVRTGAYAGYGFGGFVYRRNGGVVLPSTGQAIYSGNYAGLRDYNGVGGIDYASGRMTMAIDFNGFANNCTGARCADAVRGEVFDRRVFDVNGNDITASVVTAINTERDASLTGLPVLRLRIGPGVMDANGEIRGEVTSQFANNDGRVVAYEQGNYYAIMSGDHTTGGEVVGILVVEAANDLATGSTVRETGGFILQRGATSP
jgi:hypothetical protein